MIDLGISQGACTGHCLLRPGTAKPCLPGLRSKNIGERVAEGEDG